jgi:predicted dehydrogenase
MTLEVLFVGLGSIGQRHLRNLWAATEGRVEIFAVRRKRGVPVLRDDMSVDEDGDLARRYGIGEFGDLSEALERGPDLVFVTNPSNMHIPVATEAVRAGAHVFVEKPLSSDLEGIRELAELARRRGVQVMVGYQFRFHPGLQFIKSVLEKGRLGRIVGASFTNGEYMPGWQPYGDYRDSYAARSDLGGGALVTQIHDFDMAYEFFGLPERLFSVGGHLSELEVDVEDSVTTLMSYGSGGQRLPVTIRLDYLQSPPDRSLVIIGDRGKISWNFQERKVRLFLRENTEEVVRDYSDLDRNHMFEAQMKRILQVVAGQAAPMVGLREALASLRMALGAKASMLSGQPIVMAEFGDLRL